MQFNPVKCTLTTENDNPLVLRRWLHRIFWVWNQLVASRTQTNNMALMLLLVYNVYMSVVVEEESDATAWL